MSLTLKENTISNFFYYIHIIEIPTNKDANSYKLKISEIGNEKQIERRVWNISWYSRIEALSK